MAKTKNQNDQWSEAAQRLEEIRDEITELLADAEMVLEECRCGIIARRCQLYWLGHMEEALGNQGRGMYTMNDAIAELQKTGDEDGNFDDDEE